MKRYKFIFERFLKDFFIITFLLSGNVYSQVDLLVNFGPDASSNSFGLSGWNTLIKSPAVNYSSLDHGGLFPSSGYGESDDCQGFVGSALNFQPGERIVVTWHNISTTETYTINGRISFTDSDAPNENRADGNWFGYQGENMRLNRIVCDLPTPEFDATDPNGKVRQAHDYIPMSIFYNPDDLASVARSITSYTPQPYAAKRFDENIFSITGKRLEIASSSYDNINNRLFATEFNGLNDGRLIIHVFDYDSTLVSIPENDLKISQLKLYQNYSNPFNPTTTIKYSIPSVISTEGRNLKYFSSKAPRNDNVNVRLIVYDILGREIATLVNKKQSPGNYEVNFSAESAAGGQPSGIYFVRLEAT